MAWYVTQSLTVVLATFALGLIVGWLWWGRAWRKVPFGESDAVRMVSDRYRTVIAQRDSRLEHLSRQPKADERPVPPAVDASTAGTAGTAVGITQADVAGGSSTTDSESTTAQPPAPDRPGSDAEAALTPGGPAVPTPETDPDPEAILVGEAEPARPDDLQRIEGVGPRIAAALDNAGLSTYAAVAGADEDQLGAALREAGLSFAPSLATWSRQAGLLAAGDEEGLAALQGDLTAGRSRRTSTEPEPADQTDQAVQAAAPAEAEAEAEALDDSAAADDPATVSDPAAAGETTVAAGAGATGRARPSSDAGPTGDAAAEDEGDELERIEGIGPRIATALRKAGIHTYHQLAATDPSALQAALTASGLRFAPSLPTWSRQAALLAEGDEAGFLALTRTLVPDREGGRPA